MEKYKKEAGLTINEKPALKEVEGHCEYCRNDIKTKVPITSDPKYCTYCGNKMDYSEVSK